MLHDVELVVDDAAVGRPLLDAEAVRFPHVDAGSFDPTPLTSAELGGEEVIPGFFLALPAWREVRTPIPIGSIKYFRMVCRT
jgi:hypothetical protein